MLSKEKMARINELAKKSKEAKLSVKELKEQEQLRKEYLKVFRESMKGHLSSITIVDPEGNDVTPQKVKDLKKDNKLR